MWFECEQPFLSGERCVTSRKTAAKETNKWSACTKLINPETKRIMCVTELQLVCDFS